MLFKILWQNCKINLLFFFKSIQKNLCFLEFFNFLLLLLCISTSIFTTELHHWLRKYSAIKKKSQYQQQKEKTTFVILSSYPNFLSRQLSKLLFEEQEDFSTNDVLQKDDVSSMLFDFYWIFVLFLLHALSNERKYNGDSKSAEFSDLR